jgi:predicted Zn-dependent protease with MMP-like domain/Flp pilus assembly protein TadD
VAEALERFDTRFEEGEMEAALEVAEAGLRLAPGEAGLHHARGLALWGLERHAAAAEAMMRALELDPALPDPHLDLAALRIDPLDAPLDALRGLKAARRALSAPELRAAAHVLAGRAWLALEDPRTAEKEVRKAVKLQPEDGEIRAELAEAQVEAGNLARAQETLREALALDPGLVRARWLLAVLLDRDGDPAAVAAFEEAARTDPDACFVPERLDDAAFDLQVEKALAAVPPRFRRHLRNTEIAVEPYPSESFVRDHQVSPLILGLFLGTPLTQRTFELEDLPPRIIVFQRNLENCCRNRRELVREIGITLRHEIGHLLGMEEDDLEDAGHA